MNKYNVLAIYDMTETKLLMCLRAKEPYKGKLNFVGGKVEPGESEDAAAYRELFEETGISDIELYRVMDILYYGWDMELEVYYGVLKNEPELKEERNKLFWISRTENFLDTDRFAGECNIEHILRHVDLYKDKHR